MAVYFKNSYKSDGAALPLSVKNVGFQQCTPGYRWGAGVRDHYLIHYVVSGRGTFTAAGRAFPVRAGEVFLVWPNVVVSYEADTESPWEYYWLGFSGPDAAALLARTDLRPDAPVLHIDFGRTFQRYITAIYEARGQSAWSRTQMLGYAYLLLGKLIEGREGPEDRGDVIDRAAAYIENNYAEPITVDDIAAFAGVSRSWLYRGFMQRFGRSPTALLRETRLKTAPGRALFLARVCRQRGLLPERLPRRAGAYLIQQTGPPTRRSRFLKLKALLQGNPAGAGFSARRRSGPACPPRRACPDRGRVRGFRPRGQSPSHA